MSKITWHDIIGSEKKENYFQEILHSLSREIASGKIIYPPKSDIFNAFRYTKLNDIKVVILGQDPYHGPNQAHGLSFSVKPGIKPPPSLLNIYKELSNDICDFKIPKHGYLVDWAKQGILLLNTVLTVESGKAHSHAHLGWERFTDRVIQVINDHLSGVVFLLWGAHAQKKGAHIDASKHLILTSVHPSPLSAHRGFLGCKHFSKTNQFLETLGKSPIDWHLNLIVEENAE